MKTNLVLQSFGNEREYRRALLTIWSYYAHTSCRWDETRVLLFTDDTNYFKAYTKHLPIQYVSLTPEKIKEMRGGIDFLHRIKIAIIERAFEIVDGNIIYADSDTFFIADPTPLVMELTSERSFMHVCEYDFASMKNLSLPAGKTFVAFLNLLETQLFKLADGRSKTYSSKCYSWNAGVMMFHPTHAKFIPDVYTLTDQFYPATLNHASEQYAFSLILQENTVLNKCDSVIYHYWYRVKKRITDEFLANRLNKRWAEKGIQEKVELTRKWCSELPAIYLSHSYTLKDNAIQAFNNNQNSIGYKNAFKALVKSPFDFMFLKDLLYHTKQYLKR